MDEGHGVHQVAEVDDCPADPPEPGEAVVEWVAARGPAEVVGRQGEAGTDLSMAAVSGEEGETSASFWYISLISSRRCLGGRGRGREGTILLNVKCFREPIPGGKKHLESDIFQLGVGFFLSLP